MSDAPIVSGIAANALRRDGELRTDTSLGQALGHPQARVYLASRGQWLCGGGEAPDPGFQRGRGAGASRIVADRDPARP